MSDSFDDLLCSENSGEIISAGDSSAVVSPACFDDDESIAEFIVYERIAGEFVSPSTSSVLDSSSRYYFVSWILKVHAFYGFQPMTAYLAVNYFDRFLSCHHLPQQPNGWPLQLLSVACLSLAAKMEEPLVPSLLHLQVGGAKFIFEPKTVQRMELLVLGVLQWRMRSITPFTYLSFFAFKLDVTGASIGILLPRSTDIILSNIQEGSLLEYPASSIAAAAILCAASEMPNFSSATPELAQSWCASLSKDKVSNCYELMRHYVMNHSRPKSIKVIPQFRVTAQITRTRSNCCDSLLSSSSSSTSSLDLPSINKRRKLENTSWVDDTDDNHGSSR